ncbi:MAG: hypothetical protein JWN25_2329 [Verrucomicrobiales bacterium]|nr:hypothetical protein [Verrucomicrobiales bacterium]
MHSPDKPNSVANRLLSEKSPYLLQHAYNPVDWFPWGAEAFEKARNENKPILVSIGYSTCHWCHVMERESFEDPALGAYLRDHFVSIKVDREERPDVDKIYMTAVQAISGQGGWPLNCFLTPDLKPFYGGTYYPPERKYGRASFMDVLQQVSQLWKERKEEVIASAEDLHLRLEGFTSQMAGNEKLHERLLHSAVNAFKREYEPKFGGFGNAPKFPRPAVPIFVLREALRYGDKEALQMVLHTCDAMAAGGLNDQIGGGFSRYSVDAQWLVPHFEKMLYDNAQLLNLYLDSYLVTGEKRYSEVANRIVEYLLRDMTHPEGGFYSAEDADSEGKEGKFYCWTKKELANLLTPREFEVVVKHFGITEDGNFVDHSDPDPLPNQNVLSVVNPKLTPEEIEDLRTGVTKMFNARNSRVRPGLDDKILASWNGLMLHALARAALALDRKEYLQAAEKNLAFLKAKLWDVETQTLFHRWRDGSRDTVQLLDAYAALCLGVTALYESTLNPDYLEFAISLAKGLILRFYDSEEGGFFQSAAGSSDLILRIKEDYDGAEPSGNSVACYALLKLSAITEIKEFRDAAEKSLSLLADRFAKLPQAVPFALLALDFMLEEPKQAVITGVDSEKLRQLLKAVHTVYKPNKVVLGNRGPVEPFAKTLPDSETLAYICAGTFCHPPTSETKKIPDLLK